MNTVIRIENLSKKYIINHQEQERYLALRDVMANRIRTVGQCMMRPFQKGVLPTEDKSKEEFWALKDVSFEVKQGERLGIIGRNGAGKSTLLKILSKITEPSSGRIRMKGRVASLLEVGTGFHPELTGRENIYLNGAILGMKKTDIKRKFEEIVEFAEVEKFLDTPVKRYSSGMYVRLAFAVAANLEPEILIVDEVLAVGDAAFQKKCLGKMGEVSGEGRTVIFVSHNMGAISQLCQTAILLKNGELEESGSVQKVIKSYLSLTGEKGTMVDLTAYRFRKGTGKSRFKWVRICNSDGASCKQFSIGDDISIEFCLETHERMNKQISMSIHIITSDGIQMCNILDSDSKFQIYKSLNEEFIKVSFSDIRFYPDTYSVSLWSGNTTGTETYDWVETCISFDIIDGGKLTTRRLPIDSGRLFLTPRWERETNRFDVKMINS